MLKHVNRHWTHVPADESSDAIVASLALAGVEYIFFTSGSELVFFQEAIAKASAHGRPAPKIVTMVNEHAGLNAALGFAALSGKPVATAVHVDAGTLNMGGAIHTAHHSGLPLIMFGGAPPTAYPGSMRGARDVGGHIWAQQTFDQNTIVRQYVKWDHRLEYQDNPGLLVSRALQVALSEPRGPVYLSIPREISLLPQDGASFPTAAQLGISKSPWPEPAAIAALAERLIAANAPVIIVSASGRNRETEALLVELCELLAIRVIVPTPHGMHSFPMTHPLYAGTEKVGDADVVVVIETRVPWMPGRDEPLEDAHVTVIGIDPIQSRIPSYEFIADERFMSGAEGAIISLLDAVKKLVGRQARRGLAERGERLGLQSKKRRQEAVQVATNRRNSSTMIEPLWLSYCLGQVVDDRCVVFDDTLNTNRVHDYLQSDRPASYFTNPGTSGGWAVGAAFGGKLADPDRDMIAVTGDGFYMFGTTSAVIWAAQQNNAPFLCVIYQNRSYTTGVLGVTRSYGNDSFAQKEGFTGGYFDPPIDFAKEAEAAGAYGENVRDPADVEMALRRGLAEVRNGRTAILAFWLPRLLMND